VIFDYIDKFICCQNINSNTITHLYCLSILMYLVSQYQKICSMLVYMMKYSVSVICLFSSIIINITMYRLQVTYYIQKNHATAVLLSCSCIQYFFCGLTLVKDLKTFESMLGTCLAAEIAENS